MSVRLGKSWNGLSLAVCLGVALAGVSSLAGCLGGGDDNTSPPFPIHDGGDARAADAMGSDAPADGGPPDARDSGEGGDSGEAGDATVQEASDAAPTSPPVVFFSSTAIDFGAVGCGAMPATKTLTLTNNGGSPLAASASLVGSGFSISPTSFFLPPAMSAPLTVTVSVPGSATAGTPLIGSLALFTNDPNNANRILPLSATPSGATLTGSSLYAFASSEVGTPAPPVAFQVKNSGNAPAVFAFGAPSDPHVTINGAPDAGAVTLNAGDTWGATASFTPTTSAAVASTLGITATGVTCGTSLSSIAFTGQGATGQITGWPSNNAIDFGSAACGGAAPAPQTITLTNTGTTDARVTTVDTSHIGGFATDARAGARIPAFGGTLTITVNAPAVPSPSPPTAVTAALAIQTDADTSAHTITLTEKPQGAILAFDTSVTSNFGSFGTVILLQSASQKVNVTNAGNAPANVTLTATENAGADAGVDASADGGGDAGVDATVDSGIPPAFSPSVPTFTIPAATSPTSPSAQQDSVTFQPVHANATVGTLSLTVDSKTALCAVLPAPLPLSGNATGGGPVVTPTALTFGATCGGAAPAAQTFVVSNAGTVNMSWTMSAVTGPGAAQYTVTAKPPAGLLIPGASSTVTVTAAKVAAPAPNPNPAALAAQVTIGTDVPYDPPHVVTLSEVPLGDQLSLSVGSLRFGQFPINTAISQNFIVTNGANAGSPAANLSLSLINGLDSGAAPYTVTPPTVANLAPAGGTSSESVSFAPTSAGAYPATIALTTSDALCTPLPSPIVVSGTGTAGSVSLSATTLAFGTDPNDAAGLVNCGATGVPRTLTISNVGNQTFHVTALALGKGANSSFVLSGPAMAVPTQIAIGGSSSLTITPRIIPNLVADPNDASAFSDVLTITTDAAADTPHNVSLVMQPRGAVIANTPLPTAWSFGTISSGSIGTFTSTIQNTGNGPATAKIQGLSLANVFGLQNNPTNVAPKSVAALVGQFTPPSTNGTWTDRGQLVVSAPAFCAGLPNQWITPYIDFSGSSNGNPSVTFSGNLVFPTTNCAAAPPAGQSVTLANATNQSLAYTVKFASGTWYTVTDSGAGSLAANGVATIVVNPKTVSPAQGVIAGSAPYGDDLLIAIATSPATKFTVPVSWTLNGAVLSLPKGAGPNTDAQGHAFYPADSTSGFSLAMDNAGTAAVGVDVAVQPSGAFVLQPAPPVQVLPNIRALPELVSAGSSPACPTTTHGTATFTYTGPVCQPFTLPVVNVYSCAGAF